MKQLIPQSKIDDARSIYTEEQYGKRKVDVYINESFNAGVQFTLKEIEPLMVELLDWMKEQPILICQTTNGHQWASSYMRGGYFTTQQLLEEFIEFKNK